jgi:hypothetical protein
MNIGTERRGLGRGLGELFQRTEPRPVGAEPVDHGVAAPLAPVLAGSYFASAAENGL